MAKCTRCGEDVSPFQRDIFTGACRRCQRAGARPASLGCGTLLLIALIVGWVTGSMRSDIRDMSRDLSDLEDAVERLEEASAAQLEEIRELSEALEADSLPES
ncbi:MAG: hypothetical protein HKO65_15705 [Gemmatimonadetes bacterium]|nr:hypothetical protein [Gemmatimonadota bacterium]NNM06538.1 hypothetical protein [Gemmatimonadota bacterium]